MKKYQARETMILDLIYLCHETADKTKSLFACNPEWGGGGGRDGGRAHGIGPSRQLG